MSEIPYWPNDDEDKAEAASWKSRALAAEALLLELMATDGASGTWDAMRYAKAADTARALLSKVKP